MRSGPIMLVQERNEPNEVVAGVGRGRLGECVLMLAKGDAESQGVEMSCTSENDADVWGEKVVWGDDEKEEEVMSSMTLHCAVRVVL